MAFRSRGFRGSSFRGGSYRWSGSFFRGAVIGSTIYRFSENPRFNRSAKIFGPILMIFIALVFIAVGISFAALGGDDYVRIVKTIDISTSRDGYYSNYTYTTKVTGRLEKISDEKNPESLIVVIRDSYGYEGEIEIETLSFDENNICKINYNQIVDEHFYNSVTEVYIKYSDGTKESLMNPYQGGVSYGAILIAPGIIVLIVAIATLVKFRKKKDEEPALETEGGSEAFDPEMVAATKDDKSTHEVFEDIRYSKSSAKWKCEYCGSLNNSFDAKCVSCGADRHLSR